MIYNIPEWPKESNVNHTATTWVLARDEEFNNIEEELDESTDDLLVWEIDKIIPTGEIWYIKALRKLEDDEGNDLHNTKWIGPKPVFSEESSVSEYLAPKFFIDTPYITDVVYTEGEELRVDITPYKTNVGYINTVISVEDIEGNVLITKFIDVDETNNTLVIKADELDIPSLGDIRITVLHNGTQSTTSAPIVEILNLKNAYFKIKGNTKELDPTYTNKLEVVSTTFIGVSIMSAVAKTRDGIVIMHPVVNGNTITLGNNLDFNAEYLLEVTVQYTNTQGGLETTKKVIIITTGDTDEVRYDIEGVKYDNELTMISTTEYNNDVYSFDLGRNFNTEELFTYSIPAPDANTGKVSLYGLDKINYRLSKHIENVLPNENDFTFRLLTKTKGIVQTLDDDGVVILTPFTFNPYKDSITTSSSINTGLKATAAFVNKIAQLPTGIFIAGIDKDDNTKLAIKAYNLNSNALSDVYTYTLPGGCDDISISELGKDKVLLIPNSTDENVYRTYIYSTIENYINASVVVPGEFRGLNLLVNRLYNGNVVMFKHKATTESFNFCVYDRKTESTTVTEVDTAPDTKFISNLISLKNGDILTIAKNTENADADKAEFWIFS